MASGTDPVARQFEEEIMDLVRDCMSVRISDENKLSEEQICKQLKILHCPFTWKPCNDSNCRDVLSTTEEKLSCVDDEGEEFGAWTRFVLNLILCYEYAKSGTLEYALDKQEECDTIIDNQSVGGLTGPVMGIGLKHVSNACKIYLLLKSKLFDKAVDVLRDILPIEDMDCKDQASIWSMRGALFLEYGLKGMKESVPCIEKALELDSECGEWHFLLGKAFSRIRRIEDRTAIPDKRELTALEKAVSICNNTFYMVLLAQSYMDTSRQVYWKIKGKSGDLKSLCDAMNEKALEMYRKAMENCKENPYVLGRCGFGFMRLPHPWRDMGLAEICIFRGLERASTNSFLDHCAGMFYVKQKDLEKAKYYFNRSAENGNYSASLELLEIKQKENRLYNPVPDLERYITRYKEKPQKEHLLALLGAYHYFVKNDFNAALNAWLQIIENDIESSKLKALYNPWPLSPSPCNVSKTIINEIIRRLDEETCSEEERITFEKVLDKYRETHIALVKSVEGVFTERSKYKQWCSSEQRSIPPSSDIWYSMSKNSVGKHWRTRSDNCGAGMDWRKQN